MVGFEPTLSGTPSRRIARLSHILSSSGGWGRASGLPLFRRTLLPSELRRSHRASGGTRTHTLRFTRAAPGPSGCAGLSRVAGGSRTHTSPVHSRVAPPLCVRPQYPWQESNLHDLRLRRAACLRHTPGMFSRGQRTENRGQRTEKRKPAADCCSLSSVPSTPARSRTWSSTFGESRDVRFTTRATSSGGWSRANTCGFRARRPAVRRPRNV
jgi:hypothetical protein